MQTAVQIAVIRFLIPNHPFCFLVLYTGSIITEKQGRFNQKRKIQTFYRRIYNPAPENLLAICQQMWYTIIDFTNSGKEIGKPNAAISDLR